MHIRLKIFGASLLLISMFSFISLLFVGPYQLKPILALNFADHQKSGEYFTAALVAENIIDKPYTFSWQLVSALRKTFALSNNNLLKDKGLNELDYSKLSNQYKQNKFSKEGVDEVLTDEKAKQFSDYGSWLLDKKFASENDFKADLTLVQNQVNQKVIEAEGFSKSSIDESVFQLTKYSLAGKWFWFKRSYWLMFIFGFAAIGGLAYSLSLYYFQPAGIKNNGIHTNALNNSGWIGILLGTLLIVFYIILYWWPEYISVWTALVDPISKRLSGNEASRWFLYGFLYCIAMVVMGGRMLVKYRHSKYQIWRTLSVVFFQLSFAFLIPELLVRFNHPYFDFKSAWPLNYSFFFDWNINQLIQDGTLGLFMLVWGVVLTLIIVPVMVYFFGKRWYCSWVCGCGGLAETLGDPFRQLSDKSIKAWKIERYLIHGVLVFAIGMTSLVLYTYFTGSYEVLGINTGSIQKLYGFAIGSIFAGVVGTGFYPLMGNRVWCRFGCPLAAYLGLVQRFKSRFRITTNGGQCISCGNCSTYCEMGIDVRAYAQKGQNIVRSSCVGCGVCAEVCPRGVLKLENGSTSNRVSDMPILIGRDGVSLNLSKEN